MSTLKKFANLVQQVNRRIGQILRSMTKRLMQWLLRDIMHLSRHQVQRGQAGFILPTVTMVILVVTLLVTAIVFRSFDRAKNASNVRIDQAVLAAATPAIERAKTKLDILFDDPRLPRATPSDDALYNLLANVPDKFTFDDETQLKLAYDLDESGTIEEATSQLEQRETVKTAWRFPVDTNGNGTYDSFTLYGILFRSPTRDTSGAFNRARSPLDARTPPMDDGSASGFCEAALTTSAKLVAEGGWFKQGSKLKKSFYVYTVTVPITNKDALGLTGNYENYPGGRPGFTALEYQQDRARIPLSNNAVVFEDDLEFVTGSNKLYMNGSIITNGNLFISSTKANDVVQLYQVSAPKSCFYQEENSKVLVGGHLVNSPPISNESYTVPVHLFIEGAEPAQGQKVKTANQSPPTSESPLKVLYNSQAYTKRITHLVDTWMGTHSTHVNSVDPLEVQEQVTDSSVSVANQEKVRRQALTAYFEDRVRRVPFDEVELGDADTMLNPVGTGESLRPPKAWMFPYDPSDGKSEGSYAKIALNIASGKVKPPATEPETLEEDSRENEIGDRALVGNGLPNKWYQLDNYANYDTDNTGIWVSSGEDQPIVGTTWDIDDTAPTDSTRTRETRIQSLADVGDKGRDGFWEKAAATQPANRIEGYGGLRIVTGAGVYERKNSFLPTPTYDDPTTAAVETLAIYDDPTTTGATETFPIVWPDTMPMSPQPGMTLPSGMTFTGLTPDNVVPDNLTTLNTTNSAPATPTIDPSTPRYTKGDLRMRATAVYHYAQDIYDPENGDHEQAPIACVSSYYDPTNSTTASNSNNGKVYSPPSTTAASLSVTAPNATGLFGTAPAGTEGATDLVGRLYYQANLVFPNGRFVNEPLRNALKNKAAGSNLSLSEQSAIDSTICALEILADPPLSSSTDIPEGAIKEIAFLDARQIKAIDADPDEADGFVPTFIPFADKDSDGTLEPADHELLTGKYNLSIEERQPLEIRATQIDLDELRNTPITFASGIGTTSPSPEYLLPNSGIIYASRDDALPDLSDPAGINESRVDYKLDPTRRPSGIMLYNGEKLARNNSETFREEEKGLILVTDLPAYIWGETDSGTSTFNPHSQEEFGTPLNLATANLWDNFYTRGDAVGEENPNFACRPGDSRLPGCTPGDTWRPATVIADSMTLLSADFRFGFRVDGDFDLRNNQGDKDSIEKRLEQGFFANNYVTSRYVDDVKYSNGTGYTQAADGSSYFNNFVTPVQRRGGFREYVMEICRKLPVTECTAGDWVVGYDEDLDIDTDTTIDEDELNITASDLLVNTVNAPTTFDPTKLLAGTTARPALRTEDQRFPRRVAFLRYNPAITSVGKATGATGEVNTASPNNLVLHRVSGSEPWTPVPIGISSSNTLAAFPYNANLTINTSIDAKRYAPNAYQPRGASNNLWYRTTSDPTNPTTNATYSAVNHLFYKEPLLGTTPEEQPLLVPVLQIHTAAGNNIAYANVAPADDNYAEVATTKWQQPAVDTTFNLIFAAGNTPPREGEQDGGIANFARFLENWTGKNAEIIGSQMEFDRSGYGTAPYLPMRTTFNQLGGIFNYPQKYRTGNSGGAIPFSEPPNRLFGYDVGLLSQLPDLFSSRFTTPPVQGPDEFYREVNRDDDWVKTLLCAVQADDDSEAINQDQRPASDCPL